MDIPELPNLALHIMEFKNKIYFTSLGAHNLLQQIHCRKIDHAFTSLPD
jgi:hypothetical protein